VPENPACYSQNRAADDILMVLDHLGIQNAHICGDPAPTK
jgi:pimeloyl-ACP methyl ester carboxylesterase